MALVYVIEDDEPLREILAEALVTGIGAAVLAFGTVDEAVAAMEAYPPDMILSDLNLPGRSGLDVLEELDQRGLATPLVYLSGYLPTYLPHIPPRDNLVLLSKPFDLDDLLQHIYQTLSQASIEVPGAGAAPLGFLDYVQLSCVGGHTVEINLFGGEDGEELFGRVVVLGGELWSVQDAQGMGDDAFLRLASGPGLRVTCNALLHTGVPRNVHSTWNSLVEQSAYYRNDLRFQMGSQMGSQLGSQLGSHAGSQSDFYPGTVDESETSEEWFPMGEGMGGDAQPSFGSPSAPSPSGYTGWPATQRPEPVQFVEFAPPMAPQAPPSLDALIQAANAAEDGGHIGHALAYLEQAMAQYPGHPEILLATLRLKRMQS
ncbi:MAG TPA: response regulator [Planctomycetota bacterium]|nr:response regulator [Planctomycetota bacterium]